MGRTSWNETHFYAYDPVANDNCGHKHKTRSAADKCVKGKRQMWVYVYQRSLSSPNLRRPAHDWEHTQADAERGYSKETGDAINAAIDADVNADPYMFDVHMRGPYGGGTRYICVYDPDQIGYYHQDKSKVFNQLIAGSTESVRDIVIAGTFVPLVSVIDEAIATYGVDSDSNDTTPIYSIEDGHIFDKDMPVINLKTGEHLSVEYLAIQCVKDSDARMSDLQVLNTHVLPYCSSKYGYLAAEIKAQRLREQAHRAVLVIDNLIDSDDVNADALEKCVTGEFNRNRWTNPSLRDIVKDLHKINERVLIPGRAIFG